MTKNQEKDYRNKPTGDKHICVIHLVSIKKNNCG